MAKRIHTIKVQQLLSSNGSYWQAKEGTIIITLHQSLHALMLLLFLARVQRATQLPRTQIRVTLALLSC